MDLSKPIRVLTIRQPFAGLMLLGKEIETRTRVTNYRGQVIIHTGLNAFKTDEVDEICGRTRLLEIAALYESKMIDQLGMAIAIGELVDCRPMNKSDEALSWVKHHHSLYSWVFKNLQPIEPFQLKGRQGMNLLAPEFKNLIKFI